MGQFIIKQPDGKLAVFDTRANQMTAWDCDEDEIIGYFVDDAKRAAERETKPRIERALETGTSGLGSYRTLKWEQAVAANKEAGYDAPWEEG